MQQAASRCWRTRGAGTRFPGLPNPIQGTPALWCGGSPGGSRHIRSPGQQLPPCSLGLFPFGFPALAPGLPQHWGGRAPLPLSRAAGPAARSIPTIFSTAVAARSWCWLFLASPPAAAVGKGLRRVVLHCRCCLFGLVGAVSPWDTHGAQSLCCLCSQVLCRCSGDPLLLWVPVVAQAPQASASRLSCSMPAGPVPRSVAVSPGAASTLLHPQHCSCSLHRSRRRWDR